MVEIASIDTSVLSSAGYFFVAELLKTKKNSTLIDLTYSGSESGRLWNS